MERIHEPNHVCIGSLPHAEVVLTAPAQADFARAGMCGPVGGGPRPGGGGRPKAAGVNGRAGTAHSRLSRGRCVNAVGRDSKRDITICKKSMEGKSRWWPLNHGEMRISKASSPSQRCCRLLSGSTFPPRARGARCARGPGWHRAQRSPLSTACSPPSVNRLLVFGRSHCMSFCQLAYSEE